jgi:RNA polymerase sigma factor (sigma-70 family)
MNWLSVARILFSQGRQSPDLTPLYRTLSKRKFRELSELICFGADPHHRDWADAGDLWAFNQPHPCYTRTIGRYVGMQTKTTKLHPRGFATTHWSAVLNAREIDSEQARTALAELCRSYWFPLYGFIRTRGHDGHTAEDLTQEFMSQLFQSSALQSVDRQKGRFRAFLLASLKNFLANDHRRSQTQKRGGGHAIISLDSEEADERFNNLPSASATPEQVFDRQWAQALMEQVFAKLRLEFDRDDGGKRFDLLKIYLLDDGQQFRYADTAAKLGVGEGALKSAIYRLRQRYAELLRKEIANTVSTPAEIEAEIRYLFSILIQ